jgi:hypothetical protein
MWLSFRDREKKSGGMLIDRAREKKGGYLAVIRGNG